jgi:uncharacterized protein
MGVPNLGIGIGLRPVHYAAIQEGIARGQRPPIHWFEIISENYMPQTGRPQAILERVLEHYPVVQHGVSLAIGSPEPLDWDYLKKLKLLARRTGTPWLSDHLSWGRARGAHYHDLFPLPYTREMVHYVAQRAHIIQDFLEIPFALENVSSYAEFTANEMSEWEFYRDVVEEADIAMMLDVNNIYVSSVNHGFDPMDYVRALPMERVVQFHLAGHTQCGTHLLDTHDQPVCDEVWKLFGKVYPLTKGVSVLLEWDDQFVSLEETCAEAFKAQAYIGQLETAPC